MHFFSALSLKGASRWGVFRLLEMEEKVWHACYTYLDIYYSLTNSIEKCKTHSLTIRSH